MQRPLENIIFDDSFRNIFPAAAFRRYRSAQPTAKRRLSLREILRDDAHSGLPAVNKIHPFQGN